MDNNLSMMKMQLERETDADQDTHAQFQPISSCIAKSIIKGEERVLKPETILQKIAALRI